MKCIQKQSEPQELLQWKQQSNDDWQPRYAHLGSNLKKTIKQALMQEQGYIAKSEIVRITLSTLYLMQQSGILHY
jgi:hypothetical protein